MNIDTGFINPDSPEFETIKEIVVVGTEKGGDKKQFVFLDKNKEECTRSFNQTWAEISAIGTMFSLKGLTGKKKIAIIGENCFPWMIVYYATLVGGNITVPMDCMLPYEDLADQLIRCECDALCYTEKFKSIVKRLKEDSAVPQMHYFDITDGYDDLINEGNAALDSGNTDFFNVNVKPDDIACIVYTSGTTAKSKGVMLSHKNIASNCSSACRAHTGKHSIGFLPLNHTYSWVSALFASYIATEWGYLCDGIRNLQRDMRKYQPYNFSTVPLAVEQIYKTIWKTARRSGREEKLLESLEMSQSMLDLGIDRRRDIFKSILDIFGGNLNAIVCGGAYLDPKYEKGMYDFGIDVYNGYGMTECSPGITCNRPGAVKFGSVGKPIDCCEIKINNPDEDGVGEIFVKGTNVMLGYYNEPEATAEVFDGEWFKTGDHGRIDEDGFLFIVGRKKNLICLSNGKNISPEELEYKLLRIEYVKEVLVYDEDNVIVAEFYLNTEDFPDSAACIKSDVDKFNLQMPIFKKIGKIKVRDTEFPKTTTLKIVRNYN